MPEELETGPPIGDPPEHTHEESPAVETIVEEIEDTGDDIDELAEALAVHSIISEERHDEILERVDECRTQLETLLTTGTAENPLLTQILNQLIELRGELSALKSSMDSRQNHPPPSESEPETPPESESVAVHPEVETTPPPARKKPRFV